MSTAMKKAYKLIALLFMLVMLLGIAACESTQDTPEESLLEELIPEETIPDGRIRLIFSLWGGSAEMETTQAALDVFNASQEKIWVTAVQFANEEYADSLLAMAEEGKMPDAGMVNERTAIGWARDGLLLTYDIYAGQPNRPKDGITFRDSGQTVAYSVASEVLALWFNKEMFDEADIDYPPDKIEDAWSWDEFVEVARKLTFDANGNNPGDAGFDKDNIVQYGAYVNQWAWQLEVWALSNGGRWYSQYGT